MPSTELTILDIIKSVLPDGTRRPGSWAPVCDWPPDLFAAVATITDRSGLYAEKAFMAFWATDFSLSKKWIERNSAIGRRWALSPRPPRTVETLWKRLVKDHGKASIDDTSNGSLVWKKIVFQLLTIADEACAGIGFPPGAALGREQQQSEVTITQYAVAADYIAWEEKRLKNKGAAVMGGSFLPYLPHSLCIRVPPAIACVQPKTSTPVVGCTLRSLTHHLALLPSIANVSTHWLLANEATSALEAFNLLVVPFPFAIPGRSFSGVDRAFRQGPPNGRSSSTPTHGWAGPILSSSRIFSSA